MSEDKTIMDETLDAPAEPMSRTSLTEEVGFDPLVKPEPELEADDEPIDGTMEMVPASVEARAQPQHTSPYLNDEARESMAPTRQDLEGRILDRMRETEARGPRVRIDPLIGKTISGRFDVVTKIGAGGMGVVYKARQRGMDRWVAIKVLLQQFHKNETAVRRFQREALAVSKLEHPNTVRIFDFGETDEAMLYIAMEYLTGAPLQRLLDQQHQLPVRRVLRVVQQICRSLSEAHTKGIVHRDLKPDNVFVGAIEGQPDFVKVLDFGVAKLRETSDGGTLTQHGTIFGTPKYMSPEQCRSEDVDARSDLYAVGIMMYEMLAGRVPFESENPLAILIMHAQDEVPPLAEARPNLIVPFEVEELMHQLLAKDTDERPVDAKAVIDQCEALLHQVPDEFEEVLTYEAAEREGMDYDRSQAYTVKSKLGDMSRTQKQNLALSSEVDGPTMAVDSLPPLPMAAWKKVALASLVLLGLGGAVMGYLYSALEGLPEDSRKVIPAQWASNELPILEPELVSVTLEANVDNVTVLDTVTGAFLGLLATRDTPQTFQWLREPGRQVSVQLTHGDSAPIQRDIDLDEDVVLDKAVFIVSTAPPEVEMVNLVVRTTVGEVYVSIKGTPQVYPTAAEPDQPLAIPIPRGEVEQVIEFKRAGYLTETRTFTPTTDGELVVTMTVDPATIVAAPPEKVKLTLVADAPVEVMLGADGPSYDLTKGRARVLELDKTGEPLTIRLLGGRRYKDQSRTISLDSDQEITFVVERKQGTTSPPTGTTGGSSGGTTRPTGTTGGSTGGRIDPIRGGKGKIGGGRIGRLK